jgi:hypothetical protein
VEAPVINMLHEEAHDVTNRLARFLPLVDGTFMAAWRSPHRHLHNATRAALKAALTSLLDPDSRRPADFDREYLRKNLIWLEVFDEEAEWSGGCLRRSRSSTLLKR